MLKSLWNKPPEGKPRIWTPASFNPNGNFYLSYDAVNDATQCQSKIGNTLYDASVVNAPFTYNVWVYCKSNGEATLGTIFHKGHNTPTGINVGYQLHVFAGNASRVKIGANVRHGDGSDAQQATLSDNANSNTGSLTRNTWAMVTIIYNLDGDKTLRGWVNGVQIASYLTRSAGTGNVRDDSAQPLYMGNKNNGSVTWDGFIRDATFYHGVALNQTQITNLFSGTIPASVTANYPHYEGRGQMLHDIVGGAHGVLGAGGGSAGSPVFTPGGAGTGATWGAM